MTRRRHTGCGITRRGFLADCCMGFTGLALGALLHRDGVARAGALPLPAKAKSVIWLFMLGGVSHMESFDPKPMLTKYAGKTIEESPYKKAILDSPYYRKNVRDFAGTPRALMSKIYPLQVGFSKRGRSGIQVSDWWPHVGGCIDDLCVIRSVWVTDNDHAAQYEFNTGHHIFDGYHPSVGSWVHYGLGSLNDNLPSFVALGEPPGLCCGGKGAQNASYLGPEHNAVQLAVDLKKPLPFTAPAREVFKEEQRAEFDLLEELNNGAAARYPDDAALRARIKSYELAYRMQTSVPEVFRFAEETAATRNLYGLDDAKTKRFGEQCLTARRLVERGVRFVQVYHGDGQGSRWDAHTKLRENHSQLSAEVDLPIAGLVKDLKQRGLLDETIVVWGTEFGRTPGAENADGRDHHPYGFSIWMAGGGLKRGVVHGATDELGFHAVEHRHYVTDVHATVLHQLGLDAHKLEVPGRKRLDIEKGEVIKEVIA
jgi:hypothetical protein